MLSGAVCEPGFALRIAEGTYDYERSDKFPGSWRIGVANGKGILMPDRHIRTDVMAGVMGMLGHSPRAAQDFFTRGGTVTINVDGEDIQVSSRMQYLVAERRWAAGYDSDEGDGLGAAVTAATTVFLDPGTGEGKSSAQVAEAFFAIVADNRGDGAGPFDDGWQLSLGLRKYVDHILELQSVDFAPGETRSLFWPTVWWNVQNVAAATLNEAASMGNAFIQHPELTWEMLFGLLGREGIHPPVWQGIADTHWSRLSNADTRVGKSKTLSTIPTDLPDGRRTGEPG